MAQNKKSALAAQIEREGARKFSPERLIRLALLVFGALMLAIALWQIAAKLSRAYTESRVVNTAEALDRQVRERIAALSGPLKALAQDPKVAETLSNPQLRQASSGFTDALKATLPSLSSLHLIGPDIQTLMASETPGFSYAALDQLFVSATDATAPPAQIDASGETPVLNLVEPIPGKKGPVGFVLASFPATEITDLAKAVSLGEGYLELRQSALTLGQSGNVGLLAIAQDNLKPIAGTRFAIASAGGQPQFGEAEGWTTPLILLTLGTLGLLAGLFWERLMALKRGRAEPAPLAATAARASALTVPVAAPDAIEVREESALPAAAPSARAQAPSGGGHEIDRSIFRAYDIRGVLDKTLDTRVARLIGQAVGSEAVDRGLHEIVVGRDGRLSGPALQGALMDGLRSTGLKVIDIGMVPTPVVYFAGHHTGTGSGISVTGSHNPPDYNGFKIVLGGETLADEAIQKLYQRIRDGRFVSGNGVVREMPGILDEYVERIAQDVQIEEPLKVVVDCGNGVAGVVGPRVLEAIGCQVTPLYDEVDGHFPNHHPDPSDPHNLEDLIATVKATGADIGLAFDGDGDRLGVVTAEGQMIFPDRVLMLFAQDVLTRNPGAAIIFDVKCTGHLSSVILGSGGSPIMWKTGHSLIKAKMRDTMAELAGEMSGHFFFKERWFGFDDGIYAAARLMEILAAQGRPPSEVFDELPNSVSTPELKIEMEEGEHYRFIDQFRVNARFDGARITTIDGIRADYEDGWGLVRASNTTPVLVLRFDADNERALERIKNEFRKQILDTRRDLTLPF
jgi:phosphomannomutase / phosphoglucomutase